jgi:hypothetical protein
MQYRVLLLVLLCLYGSAVSAQEATDFPAKDVIEACEGPWDKDPNSNAMFRRGFCVGVIHTAFYKASEKYCIPHSASTLQMGYSACRRSPSIPRRGAAPQAGGTTRSVENGLKIGGRSAA